jgi:two-component system, LuxR family, sensor kinase FixL
MDMSEARPAEDASDEWRSRQSATAEEALRRERIFTDAVLDSVPGLLYLYDAEGRLLRWNKKHEEITGYSREELSGMHVTDWFRGDDVAYIASRVKRAFDEGHGDAEAMLVTKQGTRIPFYFTGVRLVLDGKRYFVGIGIDMTRQKKAEEKLHEMRLQVAHVSRLSTLGEMAAELAHELNHPLYAILNYAKATRNVLAEEGPPDLDRLREWNEEIAEIALSAGESVKRLRGFARRGEAERTMCRIEEIVEEALRIVAVETRRAHVTVQTEFAAVSLPVCVDRVQIQQVVVNLVSNAIEAMQTTPANARRIEIRTLPREGAVEVSVSDCGVGLPPGKESKIFEAFVTSKPEGMGVGLSIARTIVEAHGGELSARSNPEGGATFRFSLPFAREGGCDAV